MLTTCKSMMTVCLASLAYVGMIFSSTSWADEPSMQLYAVIPFSIETFTPITMENIVGRSMGHKLVVKDPRTISDLTGLLEAHPSTKQINNKAIRLKADLGTSGDVYFVDQLGTVLKQKAGTTYSLSSQEMEQLERRVKSLRDAVNQK